jgi:hypothetical protein
MNENPGRRKALFGIAGALGGATVAAPFLAGETPAQATTPAGQAVAWVGPAGSGAPYEIDTSVGAQGAINAALTATGQGAVYIVGGTFTMLAPVVIGNEQTLIGAGPLSTILTAGSGFSGAAMIMTPSGSFTGSRMCIRDIGLEGKNLVANGVNLQISGNPTDYGPDPNPWLSRVFVSDTTSDGIYLGGSYSGGEREFKITECRVEHAGGWAYNLSSSDGFLGGCSVQGCTLGGYYLNGGNIKAAGCKAYYTGNTGNDTPGPAFHVATRATIVGCEAQDGYGCGFEILAQNVVLNGCTADSCGNGTSGRYSAGFYVDGQGVNLSTASYQRSGGNGKQMYGIYLASGVDYLIANVVSGPNAYSPFVSAVYGTAGSHSQVTAF